MFVQYSFVRRRETPYPVERERLHLPAGAITSIGIAAMVLIALAYLLG